MDGSVAAFEEFFRAEQRRLHQALFAITGSRPEAEDAGGRVWSRYEVQAWAKRWRGEKPWR